MSIDETSVALRVESPDASNIDALLKTLEKIDKISKSKRYKDIQKTKKIEVKMSLEEAGVKEVNERVETIIGDVKDIMGTISTINEVVTTEDSFQDVKEDIIANVEANANRVIREIGATISSLANKVGGIGTRITWLRKRIEEIEIPDYKKELEEISDKIVTPPDYSEDLARIGGSIEEIPEAPDYSEELGSIEGKVDKNRTRIDKIKDYTGRLETIKKRISSIKIPEYDDKFQDILDNIESIPDYGDEIGSISSRIEEAPTYAEQLDDIIKSIDALAPLFADVKGVVEGINNTIIENKAPEFPLDKIQQSFDGVKEMLGDVSQMMEGSFDGVSEHLRMIEGIVDTSLAKIGDMLAIMTTPTETVPFSGGAPGTERITKVFMPTREREERVMERIVEETMPEMKEISVMEKETLIEKIVENNTVIKDSMEDSVEKIEKMMRQNRTVFANVVEQIMERIARRMMEDTVREGRMTYKSVLKDGDDEF